MDPFSTLFGGGIPSISGGAGGNAGPSTAGPATGSQASSNVNAVQVASPFIVAGSGSKVSATTSATQTPSANAAASAANNPSNTLVYLALGFAGLALIGTLLARRAK